MRLRLLLVALLVFWPTYVRAQITAGNTITTFTVTNGTTGSGNFGSAPTTGQAVIVAISGWHASGFDTTAPTLTSGATGSFVELLACADTGAGGQTSLWLLNSITITSGTVTVQVNPTQGSANYWGASAIAFSHPTGALTTDRTLCANGDTAATDAATGNTAATTVNDELIVAAMVAPTGDNNMNISSPAATGYTAFGVFQDSATTIGYQASYKIVTGTGVQSATWTHDNSAGTWAAGIVTLYEATGGGGGGAPRNCPLMGACE